jgi:hypothetical protein
MPDLPFAIDGLNRYATWIRLDVFDIVAAEAARAKFNSHFSVRSNNLAGHSRTAVVGLQCPSTLYISAEGVKSIRGWRNGTQ